MWPQQKLIFKSTLFTACTVMGEFINYDMGWVNKGPQTLCNTLKNVAHSLIC